MYKKGSYKGQEDAAENTFGCPLRVVCKQKKRYFINC